MKKQSKGTGSWRPGWIQGAGVQGRLAPGGSEFCRSTLARILHLVVGDGMESLRAPTPRLAAEACEPRMLK